MQSGPKMAHFLYALTASNIDQFSTVLLAESAENM